MSECLALTKEEVSCRRSLGRGLDVATVLLLDFQVIPTWFQPTWRSAVSCGQVLTSEPQFTHGWKGAAVALSAKVVRAGPGLCKHLVWGRKQGGGQGERPQQRGAGPGRRCPPRSSGFGQVSCILPDRVSPLGPPAP